MRSYWVFSERVGCLAWLLIGTLVLIAAMLVSFPFLWPVYVFGWTWFGWFIEAQWILLLLVAFWYWGRHNVRKAKADESADTGRR